MLLRAFIFGSLVSVAVRLDDRKFALSIGTLIALLLAVAELVFGAGANWVTLLAFAGDLAVCLVGMTVLTNDPGAFLWTLSLGGMALLLVFKVPLSIAATLLGK